MADRSTALIGLLKHVLKNDGPEREAAISRLKALLVNTNLDSLRFVNDADDDLFKMMKDELQKAQRENIFLRQHVPKPLLTKAIIAKTIEFRWPEVEDTLDQHLVIRAGGHATALCQLLAEHGIGKSTIAMWREGTANVPPYVFDLIRSLPPRPPEPVPEPVPEPKREPVSEPKRGRGRPRGSGNGLGHRGAKRWFFAGPNAPLYGQVYRMLRVEGLSETMVATTIGQNLTSGTVNRNFVQNPPRIDLLQDFDLEVKAEGPMSWGEFWVIGTTIYPNNSGWKAEIEHRFGLATKSIDTRVSGLTAAQKSELRGDYLAGVRIMKGVHD